MKKLEVGKDYINVLSSKLIVIDRAGDFDNRGFYKDLYKKDIPCTNYGSWREATKEEVIEAFKKHLVYRYGEDWETMKIKENHSCSNLSRPINDNSYGVVISKRSDDWNVWNENGLLYRKGIWVEKLEEEPKIHIKEAIKANTVIHCETEQEAERILKMAHELGYKWCTREGYKNNTEWNVYEDKMCYDLLEGAYSAYDYFKNKNYTIIPSTQIADLEEKKTTDWTPAPEYIESMNKKASEKLPIDKVTTKNLDIALRMVGIQLDINIIDKVIDLVELIENKGDDVTIKDIVSLQQTWQRHILKAKHCIGDVGY